MLRILSGLPFGLLFTSGSGSGTGRRLGLGTSRWALRQTRRLSNGRRRLLALQRGIRAWPYSVLLDIGRLLHRSRGGWRSRLRRRSRQRRGTCLVGIRSGHSWQSLRQDISGAGGSRTRKDIWFRIGNLGDYEYFLKPVEVGGRLHLDR